MRLRLPSSLRGQTLAVLILGLAASHLLGLALYSLDRRDAITSAEGIDLADRVVGVVTLIERIPGQWRADIVHGSDGRAFHVMLGATPEAGKWSRDGELVHSVSDYLKKQLPSWPADRLVVSLTDLSSNAEPASAHSEAIARITGAPDFPDGDASYQFLHISLRLDGNEWLNFVGAIRRPPTVGAAWASVYVLTVALGVGLVSIWLVARVTAPLTAFARAAERLGKNIRAEALPESGPREVAQAAHAFNAMQERLRRLVENRTQFLAAVSHDLRTPITLLRLRAEMMEDAENQAKTLRTLDEMETMIAAVLDFTKATSQDEPQQQVDLAALIGSVCDDWADTGADVRFEPPERMPYICRRQELQRVVMNLIDNALKYGGTARVALQRSDDTIDITVDDDGPGIAPENLETIFKPFQRVERADGRDGVGLGLSIAQSIVHAHGGGIRLENRPGGGLRATVSLPV